MNCNNCNTEVKENFCPNCGEAKELERIDGHYIMHEITHVLHLEKGFLFTIRELITRPGENVKNYITNNRSRLVKPILFIILTSLFYSIVNNFFHFEDSYIKFSGAEKTSTTYIFQWIQAHYGYANIMMGIFIALWCKLFFKKYQYNFFEILILLCFAMGLGMLIFSVFAILQGLFHIELMQVAGIVGFVYTTWAIGQFFEKGKLVSYIKALFAYLLGMLTFLLLAVLIGTLADLIIK
ncbi:MAG: hypothetical protein CVV25_03120 [Ignavibacteriae bacterium HGW-Ignavibacteriae-4]|jgi:hypothetical protein|nr:MAG: hypothetical protein CVV25_03120 [Ignavibacteriae bacterium HGW-Ignavibacteriae-4]